MPDLRPAQWTTLIRGLLATPSGDADQPFDTVVLETVSRDVAAGESEGPPLRIAPSSDADGARDGLAAAVKAYEAEHGRKPRVVLLPEAALRVIETSAPTDAPLRNRVALVSGAAGAIGHAICRALLNAGACVAVTDLPGERLDALVAELEPGADGRVMGAAVDVTDPASVAAGFDATTARFGGVDILIANAGIALARRLVDLDLGAFRRLECVNVEGTLLTLAEAGRRLRLQGTGGDIVVMSTKNVPCPGAGFGAYSATKASAHQLARIASLEFAEFGVRVNMVSPDAVFGEGIHRSGLWAEVGPERMRARGLDDAGLQEYYRNRNLLKARVTARHVADAVLFFVTRKTPTTGATIPVDGGLPDATPR